MLRRLNPALAILFVVSVSMTALHSEAHGDPYIKDGVLHVRPPYTQGTQHEAPTFRASAPALTAASTDINFDEATVPCVFLQTTALRNTYQSLGVLFSGPGPIDGGAILNQCGGFGFTGYSPPNFVAFNSFAAMSDGGIPNGPEGMSFSTDVSSLRVGVASYGGTATLNAYSATMQLLATTTVPSGTTFQLLQVAAPGIRFADLTVSGSSDGVWIFDDLSFEAAPPCPPTEVAFDLHPNTLNLKSMGHWVTANLEPEPPAAPGSVDIGSILLNGTVPVDPSAPTSIGDADEDGLPDLTVKFDREAVQLAVQEGDAVPVTATGHIGGGCFEATDVIRVKHGQVNSPTAATVLQAWSQTEVRWDTADDVPVQWVALLSSSDRGQSWTLEASHLPNNGNCPWIVRSDANRVAIVLVESANEDLTEVNGVLAISDAFVISSPLGVGEPSGELALQGALPNPGTGLSVSFRLQNSERAFLSVFDVTGRQVSRRELRGLGSGQHVVRLAEPGTLVPGVYLVHLVQGARRLVARAVVVN